MAERASTGIFGLDDLLEGGFPKGRTMLVSGACGTGKSIFCMQFLYHGATEKSEPGVFVTFDESPENIRSDMMRFGWNLAELEKHQLFALIDGASARAGTPSPEYNAINPGDLDVNRILMEVLTVARRIGARRIVLDSIPALAFQLDSEQEIRKTILRISQALSRSGMTTIMTSETQPENPKEGSFDFSKYGVEEYVADGVILLNLIEMGERSARTITIRKMRGTRQNLEMHPFDITEKGIIVKKVGTLG